MKHTLLSLLFIFSGLVSKAQHVNESYAYTYKVKLQGVNSPGDAKNISSTLCQLFDSKHQTYSTSDSTITIRSAVNTTETTITDKLHNYGFQVLFFHKDMIVREDETQK